SQAPPDGCDRVDFAGMKAAAEAFATAGASLRSTGERLLGGGSPPGQMNTAGAMARINRALIMAERDLIEPAGLPDRPWYRHVIYAPGLYTGYGVKTIPGVREAIDSANFTRAAEQAGMVIRALQRATRTLSEGS